MLLLRELQAGRTTQFVGYVIAIALLAAIAASGTANAFPHRCNRPQKLTVHFLATETLIRVGLGLNQDTYLAELVLKGKASRPLVRIIDEYSSLAPSITQQALSANKGTAMRIRRDDTCDIAYAGMNLRTAPGDRLAILPIKLSYQPSIEPAPDPAMIVPCYKIVRK